MGQYVVHKVHSTSLPTGTGKNLIHSRFQFFVGIADNQLNPFQASFCQAAQELEPEGYLLVTSVVRAQDCALTLVGDSHGNNHGRADHPAVLPHLQIQSIQPDIGIFFLKWALAKVLHQLILVLGDTRDLTLVKTARARRLHQVIDLAGVNILDVGHPNHNQKGFFASLIWFQLAGELLPFSQLSYPQGNLTFSGLPHPRAIAIALVTRSGLRL